MATAREVHNAWAEREWEHYQDRMAAEGAPTYEYLGGLMAAIGPRPANDVWDEYFRDHPDEEPEERKEARGIIECHDCQNVGCCTRTPQPRCPDMEPNL